MNYYVAVNGESTGPFTLEQLKQRGLTPNTLIWYEGLPSWVAASTVPEVSNYLFGARPVHNPGSGNVTVVNNQVASGVESADGCPPVHLALAIISAVVFPLGIAAVVKAALVRPRWNAGRYEDAEYLSKSSKKFAILSLIFGAVFWVLYFIYIVAVIAAL